MQNWESMSEDAQDSSVELRGVAPLALIENNGLQISLRGKVDAMEGYDSIPMIWWILTASITSPTVREFLQQTSHNYSNILVVWHNEDEQINHLEVVNPYEKQQNSENKEIKQALL